MPRFPNPMKFTTVPEYLKAIVNGPISQPCEMTCQATCIHAVTGGEESIESIREQLVAMGQAGDPMVMANYLKGFFGDRYQYVPNASIADMAQWIGDGEVLITHGWFSNSGHVLILDGHKQGFFRVMDPYEEFDARSWRYPGSLQAFSGVYSEQLIYAACITGQSRDDADAAYQAKGFNRNEKDAWVHRIQP